MGQTPDELREELAERRVAVSHDLEAIGDRVSPGRMVERRRAQVSGYVHRAKEAVMGATESVGDAASSAGSAAAGVPDAVLTRTQGAPLAAGLVAFGVGFVAASVAPGTGRERQAVARIEPVLESAAAEVGSSAAELGEVARADARSAGEELREVAQESVQRLAPSGDGDQQPAPAPSAPGGGSPSAPA